MAHKPHLENKNASGTKAITNALKEIVEDHLEELLHVYDERFRSNCGPFYPRVKKCILRLSA